MSVQFTDACPLFDSDLTVNYPELPPLRGLLAILSLPHQDSTSPTPDSAQQEAVEGSEVRLSLTAPARPSSPHMAAQMAPFLQRMAKGAPTEGQPPPSHVVLFWSDRLHGYLKFCK